MRYPGTTFQYDFLNDNDEKLPPMLIKALTDKKPILFLINPPYGTSAGMIRGMGKTKEGISTKFETCGTLQKNKTNIDMKNADMGACSEQLYSQFLFRILQMVFNYNININICIFSKPTFMTGESFKKFRKVFYNSFKFKDGILFKADTFADVSGSWGVSFTIWEGEL
jgi:hypothetical protein